MTTLGKINLPILRGAKAFALILLTWLGTSPYSYADVGVDWLTQRVTPTESYDTAFTHDIATPFQATTETLRTLFELEATAPVVLNNALQLIETETHQNTEYLASEIIVKVENDADVSSHISELISLQNDDGGFGFWHQYNSTPLDTAYALEALGIAGFNDAQVISQAMAFLQIRQTPAGGFALNTVNESSVYVTAIVARALQQFLFQVNITAMLEAATNYLYQHQSTQGSWGADFETALALDAVVPMTTEAELYQTAVNQLKTAQGNNGSWQNDLFTTAVALRTLDYVEQLELPADPDDSTIVGYVVDGRNGLPLSGVVIALADHNGIQARTDDTGHFLLEKMAPGAYTLNYQQAGYEPLSQSITVQAKQLMNLGAIQLTPPADIGFITGRVSSASTGKPLAGILIEVSGDNPVIAFTDNTGYYQIAIPPGQVNIAVQTGGDELANASEDNTGVVYNAVYLSDIDITAGNTFLFSPALSIVGSKPSRASILKGTVVDGYTGMPLYNALISLGGATTYADQQGVFSVRGLKAGQYEAGFSAAGYWNTPLVVLIPQGMAVDLGLVPLTKLATESMIATTVTGKVLNARTGLPIANASVRINELDKQVETTAKGHYVIEGVTALNFSLLATAPGYTRVEHHISQAEYGAVTLDISLNSLGFSVTKVNTDQPSYIAYSKAIFYAQLNNTAAEAKTIQMMLKLLDEAGHVIDHQPMVNNTIEGLADSVVVVPASASLAIESDWNNNDLAPGIYRGIVQAYDEKTWQLLAEGETSFTIELTKAIDVTLIPEPRYSFKGVTEQIAIRAEIENRSNVATDLAIAYSWIDPERNLLRENQATIALTAKERYKSVVIDNFSHSFTLEGKYGLQGEVANNDLTDGDINGVPLSVAPGVHIIPHQAVAPVQVIPDGPQHIHLELNVVGEER
jgi:hypothetical protein